MLQFDNTYARDLQGLYVETRASPAPQPQLVVFSETLAKELGIDPETLRSPHGVAILSGNTVAAGSQPLAQAYAGHQFGAFAHQLGDGRALLLGEVVANNGARFDIQLKGSGRTPFSRRGDGRAPLGPMLREYLISESMHALGIPTTRSLAVVATGETVFRDSPLPGAVLTRVASSHIRVGTFEFFAAQRDLGKLKRLAEYSIKRHYPEAAAAAIPCLALFEGVVDRQARLLARWMLTGFVHGVMNTDNMAISGETIDYGPCAFIDHYDPLAVFSSIDVGGRYAYGEQPVVAHWNLLRFAEALAPLVAQEVEDVKEVVRRLSDVAALFPGRYRKYWLEGMRAKLGLFVEDAGDLDLANALYAAVEGRRIDFTELFRRMSDVVRGDAGPVEQLFDSREAIAPWIRLYEARMKLEELPADVRADAMDRHNPIYIPRNHFVESALRSAVDDGNLAPFRQLASVLSHPYREEPGLDAFAKGPPADFGPYITYCGT